MNRKDTIARIARNIFAFEYKGMLPDILKVEYEQRAEAMVTIIEQSMIDHKWKE